MCAYTYIYIYIHIYIYIYIYIYAHMECSYIICYIATIAKDRNYQSCSSRSCPSDPWHGWLRRWCGAGASTHCLAIWWGPASPGLGTDLDRTSRLEERPIRKPFGALVRIRLAGCCDTDRFSDALGAHSLTLFCH